VNAKDGVRGGVNKKDKGMRLRPDDDPRCHLHLLQSSIQATNACSFL
jgi:hypothetical protein